MALVHIQSRLEDLRPSERRVGEHILADPDAASTASITELAERAGVSEPTVVRFCRSVGFSGFRALKFELLREAGRGGLYGRDAAADAPPETVTRHVADGLFSALLRFRQAIDHEALERALDRLDAARGAAFFGFGASGLVALDAQHRFARLGFAAVAHTDPRLQAACAATLTREDVLVAVSQTGESGDLNANADIAKRAGATLIALTAPGSTLARLADIAVTTPREEDARSQIPMASRLMHLMVLDTLFVAAALRRAPDAKAAVNAPKGARPQVRRSAADD